MDEKTGGAAWEVWAERPWLTRFLRHQVPPDAVEDVLQETWLSFSRLGERYAEPDRWRALLQRIAARRVADWYRAQPAEAATGPTGWRELVDSDPNVTAHLLQTVGVQPGSLVWRRVVDDWSLSMLAAHAGVPVGTIKSRLAHAKRDLGRRLDDWHQSLRESDPVCAHARSDVLMVAPCPQCIEERAVWRALIARMGPDDGGFQTTYFTVESDGSLWLDAIVEMRRPLPPGKVLWGNSLAVMGPFRRLRNAYGADLLRRVRADAGSQDLLLFPLRREDGRQFTGTQHGTSGQAEAATIIRPSRQQVEIHLDIRFGSGGNGATFLELPRTLAVERANPAPTRLALLHNRTVLLWTGAADLPRSPVIVARYT